MKITLPTEKRKATKVNPETMIWFANPKVGKTTLLTNLKDTLIIDLENGSSFFDAVVIDVMGEAKANSVSPIDYLKQIAITIQDANTEKGEFVYKRIALDTVTALEHIVLPLANKMYQSTSMGKNWAPSKASPDVTYLANGAGYRYTRMALLTVINLFKDLCETLIIIAHVKDKNVGVAGEEANERMINLTGAMASILASKVDAVGYMFRRGRKTVLSFASSEGTVAGGRCAHLTNKQFDVIVSDKDNNLTFNYDGLFV